MKHFYAIESTLWNRVILYVAVSCSDANETFVYNLVHTIEQSDHLCSCQLESSETFLYN